jgi:hypothetical protein
MLRDTFVAWNEHEAPRLGAALAFYTILSMAPLVILVIAIAAPTRTLPSYATTRRHSRQHPFLSCVMVSANGYRAPLLVLHVLHCDR